MADNGYNLSKGFGCQRVHNILSCDARWALWFEKKTCSVLDFRANLLNHTKPLSISSYLDKEEDYVPMLSALRKFSHILEIVPSTRPAHKYLQVGM